jgi:hypothetical protein
MNDDIISASSSTEAADRWGLLTEWQWITLASMAGHYALYLGSFPILKRVLGARWLALTPKQQMVMCPSSSCYNAVTAI